MSNFLSYPLFSSGFRRAKWRKKENTRKGPGRPPHSAQPRTCSGVPIDPEEMKRREQETAERKRLKKLEKQIWNNVGGQGPSTGSKKVGVAAIVFFLFDNSHGDRCSLRQNRAYLLSRYLTGKIHVFSIFPFIISLRRNWK